MSDKLFKVLDDLTFKRLVDMGDGTHAEILVMRPDAVLLTD